MLRLGEKTFHCDDCPIAEDLHHRIEDAYQYGWRPQVEYGGCDKVDGTFAWCGYCEDAWSKDEWEAPDNPRATGAAYRRWKNELHFQRKARLSKLIFAPGLGWLDKNGNYLHYEHHSRRKKYLKRYSNKIVRRHDQIMQHGSYRKCFDYWWELY